jgi:hypothetical protein
VDIAAAGAVVDRERGTWFIRAGRVHTVPTACDQVEDGGAVLRPVTCGPPDSVLVAIAGNTWPIHFVAGGELVTVELKRL